MVQKYPFDLTREDLKTILSSAYNVSRNVPRGELWSDLVRRIGEADYTDEKIDYPVELDYYEETDLYEDAVAFCRSKKTGKVYVKTLYDYVKEGLEREYGEEPSEDEIHKVASRYCEAGACNSPDDFCGCDEYLGDLHTHPNYPVSPSCNDVKHMSDSRLRVICIAGKNSFACIFADPDDLTVPCRSGDFVNDLCIPVRIKKEDAFGNIVDEEYNLCPKEFVQGHESAWIQDVRRLIREGRIRGACYHFKHEWFSRDRVICDFGGKDIVEFKLSELES